MNQTYQPPVWAPIPTAVQVFMRKGRMLIQPLLQPATQEPKK